MAIVRAAALAALLASPLSAAAQSPDPITIPAAPGQPVVLLTAPCLTAVDPAPGGAVSIDTTGEGARRAVYTAPPGARGASRVILERGGAPAAGSTACTGATRVTYAVEVAHAPELPDAVVQEAFKILMAAFVIAVLLESAFALLFNWRLFLEFFVGKAWRTPIMFGAALLIVRAFPQLDLISRLFAVYSGATAVRGDWLTAALTAMILAGGSVGVNRVLVALGFRSQVRPDVAERPSEKQAWISVRVRATAPDAGYELKFETVDPPPASVVSTLGIIRPGAGRARLSELLFPVPGRIPRSGGIVVSTEKAYRVSVTDLGSQLVYDLRGEPIATPQAAPLMRFAPRAIVDFDVTPKVSES